jgi:hypothetical protein
VRVMTDPGKKRPRDFSQAAKGAAGDRTVAAMPSAAARLLRAYATACNRPGRASCSSGRLPS